MNSWCIKKASFGIFASLLFAAASCCQTQAQSPSQGAATTPTSIPAQTALSTAPELSKPANELTSVQIERMHNKLQDWPNLSRYRADNAKLSEPAKGEQRVVFYGDSITDFWRTRGSFFPGKPYIDRGISGQTTPQMLVRFQQDVLALHPAVVVILAGINDIAGNTGPETTESIEDNFRSMAALARSEHVRVVLCSVLPASSFPWHPGIDPRTRVTELNAWLHHFAAQKHLIYLDYYSAMADSNGGMQQDLAQDKFVHPNAAGYGIMEPLAEAAIKKALQQSAP
jgi:lysophospholipase L1-like esterase